MTIRANPRITTFRRYEYEYYLALSGQTRAAINALKDYGSMQYILDHTEEEIGTVEENMTSVGSPALSDMPKGPHNP